MAKRTPSGSCSFRQESVSRLPAGAEASQSRPEHLQTGLEVAHASLIETGDLGVAFGARELLSRVLPHLLDGGIPLSGSPALLHERQPSIH